MQAHTDKVGNTNQVLMLPCLLCLRSEPLTSLKDMPGSVGGPVIGLGGEHWRRKCMLQGISAVCARTAFAFAFRGCLLALRRQAGR